VYNSESGEALENIRASCKRGIPPEGGDSVMEIIKLAVALLQLLLALAELIRILLDRYSR
jgi:hypothetical protein